MITVEIDNPDVAALEACEFWRHNIDVRFIMDGCTHKHATISGPDHIMRECFELDPRRNQRWLDQLANPDTMLPYFSAESFVDAVEFGIDPLARINFDSFAHRDHPWTTTSFLNVRSVGQTDNLILHIR